MLLTIFQPRDSLMSTFERMLRVLSGRGGDEASRVAASLRPTETRRLRIAGKKGRASKRLAAGVQTEQLEQRLAMAINLFTTGGDWAVITSDNADDVFVQQVSTVKQDLLVADNASFNNYQTIGDIDAYRTVYATNGTRVDVGGVLPDGIGDNRKTTFVLAWGSVSTSLIEGTVSYGGSTWSFTNGGNGASLLFAAQTAGNGVMTESRVP